MLGLGKHSSTFSCYACTWAKNVPVSDKQDVTKRTAAAIRKLFDEKEEKGGEARDFFSVVAQPISQLPDDEPIENFVTPPELHMLLGIFAWLFSTLQKCFKDPHKIYEWPKQFHVVKSRFYGGGGSYNGNSCRLLLKNHSWLRNIVNADNIIPGKVRAARAVCEAIRLFDCVVHSMFSKVLGLFWDADLSQFKKQVLLLFTFSKQLGIKSLTPKLHVLLQHAPEWCRRRHCGLGKCSEQSFETSHHDFKHLWEQRFKVNSLNSPSYKKQLLMAVVAFASQHVPVSEALSFVDDLQSDMAVQNDVEHDVADAELTSEVINN